MSDVNAKPSRSDLLLPLAVIGIAIFGIVTIVGKVQFSRHVAAAEEALAADQLDAAQRLIDRAVAYESESAEALELQALVRRLVESKDEFDRGKDALDRGAFLAARDHFAQVIPEDGRRAAEAERLLNVARDRHAEKQISAVDKLLENQDYTRALDTLVTSLEESNRHPLLVAHAAGVAAVTSPYALSEAATLAQSGDLERARSVIESALRIDGSNVDLTAERDRLVGLIAERKAAEAEAAERERKAAEAARQRDIDAAFARLVCRVDPFDGTSQFFDRSTDPNTASDKFYLRIVQRPGGTPELRLTMMMYASTWLFWDRSEVSVDGIPLTSYNPGYFNVNRDNGSRGVWEYWTLRPSNADIVMLLAVSESSSAIVRYINSDDRLYRDRTVSSSERQAIKNVLVVYEAIEAGRLSPSCS